MRCAVLALATLCACDRAGQSASAAPDVVPAAAAAPAETTVRRIPILLREPSAMQRATGVIAAPAALEPLDSVLAVRVLDNRGRELGGAAVAWSLDGAGDGAALRVINAVTDSSGVSRAAFTPGSSANPQSAVADVHGVGRIPFTVTVPATTVQLVPARVTVWSGDDTVLTAELRDARGTLLSGGAVSWATTDTLVARATADTPPATRLRGVLAGSTDVVAWVGNGKVRGIARVTVRPVIAGRFVTIDGTPVPAMTLEALAGSIRESIAVRDAGFTARIELPPGTGVVFNARPAADARLHNVSVRVDEQRELQRLVIALVPTFFHIAGGSYAGQVLPIDAASAMTPVGGTAPFWRLVPYSGTGPRKLLSWRDAAMPLRIAFDRSRSRESISSADSAAFWDIADAMERDLGRDLFAPAELSGEPPSGVIPVEIRGQSAEGHTFVSWAQDGDAMHGVMVFRDASTLRDPHVVTHELVHLLGFGHSNSWPTVAQPSGGTSPRLTAHDVAYIQLALTLRAIQEKTGARPGLPLLQR